MKIVKTIDELVKVLNTRVFSLEKLYEDRVGCDWNYDAKTFYEMGADNIDVIEVIMDIEKIFDCVIPDDLGDLILSMNPNDLLISVRRQRKLDELGI